MSSPDHDKFRMLLAMAGNCSNLDELKLFCRILLGPPAPPESVMDLTTTSISTSPSEHTSHSNGQIEGQRYDPSSEPYSTHYGAYGEQRYDPSSEPYPMHYVPFEGRRHDTSLDPNATNEVPKVFKTENEYTRKSLPVYAIIIGIGSKSPKNRNLGATPFYHSIRNRYTPLEVVYYKLLREFEKQQPSASGCMFPVSEEQLLFVTVDNDGETFYPILEDRDSTVLSDIKANGKSDVKPTLKEYSEHLFIHIQIKKRTLQTLHDNDDCVMIVQNVLESIEEAVYNGIPNKHALDKHKTLIKETWKLYFPEHNVKIKPKKKRKENNHDSDGNGENINDANVGDDGWPGGFQDQFNTERFHEFGGGDTFRGGTGHASLHHHLHTCNENDSPHDSGGDSTDNSLPRWKNDANASDESDDDDNDDGGGMPEIEAGEKAPRTVAISNTYDQDPAGTCQKSLETMYLNPSDEIEAKENLRSKPDEDPHESPQEHNEAIFDALIDAAKNGNLVAVVECVKIGVNVNRKDDSGMTALLHTSCSGHLEVAKYLIETCHADMEAKGDDGRTALHYASRCGQLEVVKYLIETCEVDAKATTNNGSTALHSASYKGLLEVVKYLIETCKFEQEAKNKHGWTALHQASCSGHLEVVKYLIETSNVDMEARDHVGSTALHFACDNGHLEVVKYLIERCNVDKELKDNNGWTALHHASCIGRLEVVQYLIETCDLSVFNKDYDGLTAFHHASYKGHLKVVKYLLETYDAVAEAKDDCGMTALHYASRCGHLEVVKYLIETCNLDMEAKNDIGQTAYDCAVKYKKSNVMEYLKALKESTRLDDAKKL